MMEVTWVTSLRGATAMSMEVGEGGACCAQGKSWEIVLKAHTQD